MKKIVKSLACLFILCGCSNDNGESFEPTTYTYVDTRSDTVKQLNTTSLDTEVETLDDFKNHADLIIVAEISEMQAAEIYNERFRTPLILKDIEVINGEEKSTIYQDGGRMTLADYEPQMIDGYLNKDFYKIANIWAKDENYVAIVPVNYVDLEVGKTYLFFVKDGMIVNGGYGVFEKVTDNTYQNVITKEEVQREQLQ